MVDADMRRVVKLASRLASTAEEINVRRVVDAPKARCACAGRDASGLKPLWRGPDHGGAIGGREGREGRGEGGQGEEQQREEFHLWMMAVSPFLAFCSSLSKQLHAATARYPLFCKLLRFQHRNISPVPTLVYSIALLAQYRTRLVLLYSVQNLEL